MNELLTNNRKTKNNRDRPEEWPPLFGSISEAYTLRRFWGVFWHKLDLGIFKMYTPPPYNPYSFSIS